MTYFILNNFLSIFSNIGNVLKHYRIRETSICLLSIVIIILLWVIKLIIFKKKGLIDGLVTIAWTIFSLMVINDETKTIFKVLITIVYVLILAYAIYDFILTAKIVLLKKGKVQDYLKNSEFEYFVQVGKANKIIDFSANITTLTNRNKNEIKNVRFPEFLFDCMNIVSVNDEPFTLNTLPSFRTQFKETTSKLKNYEFNFEIKDEENKILRYEGIIQPIYFGKKLVAKNIYISLNRMELLEKTRNALAEACVDLKDIRNQLYVLMSLTGGVVMYYDFQTKSYIATESFQKFTRSTQSEYDFEEFLRMLHPEDVQFYIDQTATINSMSTTRLKFRMLIGEKYFNMIDDSIYLSKDDKLVSVIRVSSDIKALDEKEIVLSTQETLDILDDLGGKNIDKMADSTLDLLNRIKANKNE